MNEANEIQTKTGEEPVRCTGMGSRLWRVTVERTMMVVAADEREAEREAEYYAKEEDSLADMVAASLVSRVEDIPQEWRDSIPWGGDRKDDRTCAERVESATETKLSDGGRTAL